MADETNNIGPKKGRDSPLSVVAFETAYKWGGANDERLVRDHKGRPEPVLENIVLILKNDSRWDGVIAHNEFSGVTVKRKPPPFEQGEEGEWFDMDDARLEYWLGENYNLRRAPESALQRGVALAADANRFHEVKDYLNGLKWDQVPRLRYWLAAYLGAEESEYTALVGTKYLVGAVARILRAPAEVKMENVLILEGPQGALKSTSLKTLFSPWFTDAAFEIGSTDGYQIIRGMWGVELAELDNFNRAEASKSKAFFSRERDIYRNPYGRKPVKVVRQCVFAGSVNHATYLKDDTGNRRYWPVSVGRIDIEELAAERDQLWAEAVQLFRDGEIWYVRAAEAAIFKEQQDQRYVGDAWEERIIGYLDGKTSTTGDVIDEASSSDILAKALHLDTGKWTPAEQMRLGRIMARLGWARKRSGGREARSWVYVRPEVEGGDE